MPFVDKEAQRAYQREWVARRRADYFADKQCVTCGSVDELRLDHVDASTKVSHRIWSWSEVRRLIELAKCQVLCEPCHVAKTTANREQARGEDSSHVTLTQEQVDEIRSRYANGVRIFEMVHDYPVGDEQLCRIVNDKAWT